MAAPTPVSALVHSSTLVTAGIYMLIRFFYFIPQELFSVMGQIGLWTVLVGSISALKKNDAKKVVAFSTLRNLGIMVVSLSLGFVGLAFFHLLTHAIAKALLFIAVGYLMLKKFHQQDLRKFSVYSPFSRYTIFILVWSNFSLMGFFFLSGFFSKDLIFDSRKKIIKVWFFFVFFLSTVLTSMYSFRLIGKLNKNIKLSITNIFKKKHSKKILSTRPLFLMFVFLGAQFKGRVIACKARIRRIGYKMIFFSWFFIGLIKIKKTFKKIFKTLLKYINVRFFKSSYFLKNFSTIGNRFLKNFELGLFSKINYSLLKKTNNSKFLKIL